MNLAMDTSSALKLEIVKNAILAITEEQGIALQRAAYSTNVKTRRDYSCAFLDMHERGIAQAFAQPTHLASMRYQVPRALDAFGRERIRPGDGILTNIPHYGAIHLNDLALISPVFVGDEPLGYVVNIAHHMDIGGSSAGSLGMGHDIHDEGLVIPPVRLVAGHEVNRDVLDMIALNVRSNREVIGDLRAQVAANHVATRRMLELAEQYGVAELKAHFDEIVRYTERRSRAALARIPDGEHATEIRLDPDPANPDGIAIRVAVRVRDGHVTVDLTGSDPQQETSLNGTIGISYAGVAYALRCHLDSDIPVNHGFYESFDFVAPPGSVVNCRFPSGVVAGVDITMRLADAILMLLSEVVPEKATASSKSTTLQVAFGAPDATGEQISYYETIGGGEGARPHRDGQDGIQCHIQNTESAPIEELEANYPVRIRTFHLAPDSGGPGRTRGGAGLIREYEFPYGAASFSIVADGTTPRAGLAGGGSGAPGRFTLITDAGTSELPVRGTVDVPAGGVIRIQSPGGGGLGPSSERPAAARARDEASGLVSRRQGTHQMTEERS